MQKQKGISTLVGIIIIVAVAVVVFGGVFAYQYFAIQKQQNQNTENKTPKIEGISIEKPNLVVTGQNLSKVQIYFVPTGTEIDPETMSRIVNATNKSENNGKQVWVYPYPKDLLITNIFVKGFDAKGNLIGRVDLPIDGASALAEALYGLYGNSTNQITSWKTYTNNQYGFEIKYPQKISVTENDKEVVLNHSIPYKNYGCDMSGEGTAYERLNDFNMAMKTIDKSLVETVKSESPYIPEENFVDGNLVVTPGYIDKYSIGSLNGYSIYEGVEGCGHIIYYFPVTSTKTIVVVKDLVQELSGVLSPEIKEAVLKVPGVISSEEGNLIFNLILSTFKFTK